MSQTLLTQEINNWIKELIRHVVASLKIQSSSCIPCLVSGQGISPRLNKSNYSCSMVHWFQENGCGGLLSLLFGSGHHDAGEWSGYLWRCAYKHTALHSCPCHHHISETQAAKYKSTKWQNKVFTHNRHTWDPRAWITPDKLYGAILCSHQQNIQVLVSVTGLNTSESNDFWFGAVQVPEKHRWKFRGMKTGTNAFSSHPASLLQNIENRKHINETILCEWMSLVFVYITIKDYRITHWSINCSMKLLTAKIHSLNLEFYSVFFCINFFITLKITATGITKYKHMPNIQGPSLKLNG